VGGETKVSLNKLHKQRESKLLSRIFKYIRLATSFGPVDHGNLTTPKKSHKGFFLKNQKLFLMKEVIFCSLCINNFCTSEFQNPKIYAHGHLENEKEKGW
jgi:hypothetical protein